MTFFLSASDISVLDSEDRNRLVLDLTNKCIDIERIEGVDYRYIAENTTNTKAAIRLIVLNDYQYHLADLFRKFRNEEVIMFFLSSGTGYILDPIPDIPRILKESISSRMIKLEKSPSLFEFLVGRGYISLDT